MSLPVGNMIFSSLSGNHLDKMRYKHIGIRIFGVKTNYSTKDFFLVGGAHAPVAPPPPGYGLETLSQV